MLSTSFLLCIALPVTLLMEQPAIEQNPSKTFVDNDQQLGYMLHVGEYEAFCGVDYRIELFEYLENVYGNENIDDLSPIQRHPLRIEMLEYLDPYKEHPACIEYRNLQNKYPYGISLDKYLIKLDDTDRDYSTYNWCSVLSPGGQEVIEDIEEYNRDIASYLLLLDDFKKVTGFDSWCREHHDDYLCIVNDLMITTENMDLLSKVVGTFDLPSHSVYIVGTPMVNPGRNYMTVPSADPSFPLVHHFGPYKLVNESMFEHASWSECEISFVDKQQFISLCFHELSHTLTHNEVTRVLDEQNLELAALLEPVSHMSEQGYGVLPDNALVYIDEIVTRARTLECLRRYAGESPFRIQLGRDIFLTRGYTALMWKYFYLDHDSFSDADEFTRLLSNLPEEMKTWQDQSLHEFQSLNEYSMTLRSWFNEFIPTFYKGSETSFGVVFSEDISDNTEKHCVDLLQSRLGVPPEMELVSADDPRPFKLTFDVCSQKELVQRAAASDLDITLVKEFFAALGGPHDIALISKTSQPGNGVTISWDILEYTQDFESVIPYYFNDSTVLLVVDRQVVLQDTHTDEVDLVQGWIDAKSSSIQQQPITVVESESHQ